MLVDSNLELLLSQVHLLHPPPLSPPPQRQSNNIGSAANSRPLCSPTSPASPGGGDSGQPLPPGWQSRLTSDGTRYYINCETKSVSWSRPGGRDLGPAWCTCTYSTGVSACINTCTYTCAVCMYACLFFCGVCMGFDFIFAYQCVCVCTCVSSCNVKLPLVNKSLYLPPLQMLIGQRVSSRTTAYIL